jgi:hypothetical protein
VAAYKRAIAGIEQQRAENRKLSCSAHGERENAILIQRLPIQDSGGRPVRAHAALIHHWGAAMFIADVRPEDVTAVLQDYDHHAEIYAPEVSFSRLIDRQGSRYHVLHETLSRSLITVSLKIDSVIDWSGDERDGFASHSATTQVTEFEHAGTPRARERSPDQAKGWLWAEDSWWRVTREANGVCVTYETIALTRDVPWGWGWLIRGVIERFPATTLADMLDRTRSVILSRRSTKLVRARPSR